MTIKQYIQKYGWQMERDSKACRAMSVDVSFLDIEGREDETQLEISSYDEQELSDLFADFCMENRFPTNTVTGVTIVQVADTFEELA